MVVGSSLSLEVGKEIDVEEFDDLGFFDKDDCEIENFDLGFLTRWAPRDRHIAGMEGQSRQITASPNLRA